MAASNSAYGRTVQHRRTVAAMSRPPRAEASTGPAFVARLKPVRTCRRAVHSHGISRLDECGRLRDAAVFAAVGFIPGCRVVVTIEGGRAVVTADESSSTVLDGRCRLALGETQRKLLGLVPGAPAVVSGNFATSTVVVQPTDVLDGLVA